VRDLIDCHIHTERCGHASGTVAQMVSAGVFRGLSGMVFTEHLPLPEDLDPDHHLSLPACDLATYAREVVEMSERVKGTTIVLGAEADWLPGHEELTMAVRAEAEALGISVMLGSVHFIGEWAFDDPNNLDEWDKRDVDAVWTEYFGYWCDAARRGGFDVMAHPDLPKKFGHRPGFDTRELFAEAARAAADGGVLIEVSTAGLRRPVGELYPGPELLQAFHAAGVDATVGSDAHAPNEVGFHIEYAYGALASAGYSRAAFPVSSDETRFIEL
jgi:histidinol-phosphatase (PHP family)